MLKLSIHKSLSKQVLNDKRLLKTKLST